MPRRLFTCCSRTLSYNPPSAGGVWAGDPGPGDLAECHISWVSHGLMCASEMSGHDRAAEHGAALTRPRAAAPFIWSALGPVPTGWCWERSRWPTRAMKSPLCLSCCARESWPGASQRWTRSTVRNRSLGKLSKPTPLGTTPASNPYSDECAGLGLGLDRNEHQRIRTPDVHPGWCSGYLRVWRAGPA